MAFRDSRALEWSCERVLKCRSLLTSVHPHRRLYIHSPSQSLQADLRAVGCIKLDIDIILFFGLAGNGKTSALAVLLGLPPPDIRCSTPLMKRPIFMSVNEKMKWKERTREQMQDICRRSHR